MNIGTKYKRQNTLKSIQYTLEKTEGPIKNGHSRDNGNIEYKKT